MILITSFHPSSIHRGRLYASNSPSARQGPGAGVRDGVICGVPFCEALSAAYRSSVSQWCGRAGGAQAGAGAVAGRLELVLKF